MYIIIIILTSSPFFSSSSSSSSAQVFGHDRVSVLDGGLPKWVAEGRPTVSGEQAQITPTTFKAHYCPHLVRSMKEMIENYHSKKEQV